MNSGAPVMTRGNQFLCLFLVSHFRREKGGASYGVRGKAAVMAFNMSSCYGDCYSDRRIARVTYHYQNVLYISQFTVDVLSTAV